MKPSEKPKIKLRAAGMRTDTGLTPQQEAYCRCRAMGMNIEESLSAVGDFVSPGTAAGWEKTNLGVRKRIQDLSAIADKNAILKTGLDREWVIRRLQSVVERCMTAEPVLDRQGNPVGEYKFDSSGANQALKMLGDTLGMFRQQEKKDGDEYAELTDDEIARIATELAAQTGLLGFDQGTQAEAGSQQVVEVQAIPKADGVPPVRVHAPRKAVQSRKPAWEDMELGLRDRFSSDGDVPGMVEGKEVE